MLGLAQDQPSRGRKRFSTPFNHPSYIWYAADPESYDGDEQKADEAGLKVIGQDLSAACWQAGMGPETGERSECAA